MSAQAQQNEFQWWQDALAGKSPPIHEGEPQVGYFRVRFKDKTTGKPGPWEAACIYNDGGKLLAFIGNDAKDASEVWTWLAKRPISYELYTAVMDRGEPWPDDISAEIAAAAPPVAEAGMGHNARRPEEEIRDEIATLDAAFSAWLAEIGGSITTDEQDAKAESFRARFLALENKAEEARTEAKRPVLDEGRRIDAAWKPVTTAAEVGKKKVGSIVTPYRVAKDNARREAEAKAREADRAALMSRSVDAPPDRPAPRAIARPTGLRTYKVVKIEDLAQVVGFILAMESPPGEFVDTVKTLAGRMLNAGVTVPGATIVEERRA